MERAESSVLFAVLRASAPVAVAGLGIVLWLICHRPERALAQEPGESAQDQGGERDELRSELEELRQRVDMLEEDLRYQEEDARRQHSSGVKVGGYIDVGAAYVQGDGSGIRPDLGYRYFPEFEDVPDSWVFMGDPLSTAINARGEPADTGESRAVAFDSVDSGGAATFIVNTMSVSLFAGLGERLTVHGMLDVVPRNRDVSDVDGTFFGDFVDLPLAYATYRVPASAFDLELSIGKFDSVLGVEYRRRNAPDRIEVTPSLICRYTCGRPVGLKARLRLLEERNLVFNLAVTNGSHFVQQFPFPSDVDLNDPPTVAGRLSYMLPIGPGIDVGASGAVGSQDSQPDNGLIQWHFGFDVLVDWDDLVVAAEFVRGEAPGDQQGGDVACGVAPCLEYRGAYGRVGYRFTNYLLPYVRVDWRDALHQDGANFVYISDVARLTAGVRVEPDQYVVIKAEYTINRELGDIPQFDNDVLTSSFVVRF